jgi:EF hand
MKIKAVMMFLVAASFWVALPVARAMDMPMKMADADANHDGKLSMDEFLAHCKERFARLDTDKDGFLSPDEATQKRQGKGGGMGEGMKKKPMIQEGDEGEGE